MTVPSNELLYEMLKGQKETLDRIEGLAAATNGRVRQLELWQAKMAGATIAVRWIPTLLSAVAAAVLTSVLT